MTLTFKYSWYLYGTQAQTVCHWLNNSGDTGSYLELPKTWRFILENKKSVKIYRSQNFELQTEQIEIWER